VFRSTGVPINWCFDQLVFRSTGVPINWCSDQLVFRSTGTWRAIRTHSDQFFDWRISYIRTSFNLLLASHPIHYIQLIFAHSHSTSLPLTFFFSSITLRFLVSYSSITSCSRWLLISLLSLQLASSSLSVRIQILEIGYLLLRTSLWRRICFNWSKARNLDLLPPRRTLDRHQLPLLHLLPPATLPPPTPSW